MKKLLLTPSAMLAAIAGTTLGQSTDPFPAQFELSSLLPSNGGDGSTGFILNGVNSFDQSGFSVSSAGDINGDGIDDMIIGAVYADPNGKISAGVSYVVFGSVSIGLGGLIELSTLDGTIGFVLKGTNTSDYSGAHVSRAGDINGDGIDDIVIGAPAADPNGNLAAGISHVVFGAHDVGAGGVINLSSLNGTNGFKLNGVGAGDLSGLSVTNAGDVNGDGIDDLIIGAYRGDPNDTASAGKSYVVFGAVGLGSGGVIELASLIGTNGFVINGIDTNDYSGFSVSSAGDVNGDGIDDLIIGAHNAAPNGIDSGESYVVFGATDLGSGGVIELASLNGASGFVINGIGPGNFSGVSVSSAGDINGDGIDDLVIGAYFAAPNENHRSGQSYVVFGALGIGSGGVIELSSLNGTNGFVLNGINVNDRSGRSVSSAGDVNGDGFSDLIIGAYFADPFGLNKTGSSYVIFGATGVGSGGVINLASLISSKGFAINGIDADDLSGFSVSAAGDVNGDGIDDLIIGARYADPNGNQNAGESYVIFGRDLAPSICLGDADGSGSVDFNDITSVLSNWLNDYTPSTGPGDATGDGIVNFNDITSVLSNWLVACQ